MKNQRDSNKRNPRRADEKVSGSPKHQQRPEAEKAPKTRVARAKKLAVRPANQKVQSQVRRLQEQRSDLSGIEPVRLQKALAASGVGSRREMEEWIQNGWVTVNGKVAQLGDKVRPEDQVLVKGSVIKLKWPDRLPRIIL